ncbi:MAG: TlpA family protein disulfide reductase [Prevotellaceae bacterium]|jgi:peroxiredoxin|nr:TlpA family protein disulfide reductase [Prevotellaceae bacterium]
MNKILIISIVALICFSSCSTNKKNNNGDAVQIEEQMSDSLTENTDERGYIVNINDKAPEFTIKYIDGRTEQLSNLKGKTVMLQFTASWCSVCRKEMPFIESDIWQKHKNNENFVLIGIDLKEDAETVGKFVKSTGVTYPITLDEDGKIFELYAEKDAGVTRNILIDKNGKIEFLTRLYDEIEFENLKQHIEKLLE